jgi:hypothetical protein
MADVENALTVLAADQLLIVSVMGDDYESSPKRKNVIRDFSATAKLAETAGAYVVELNLSCPNSLDTSGKGVKPPICLDPSFTRDILEEARSCLDSSTRLVAKLSFLDEDILPIVIDEIAPLVDGIAGVNTLQCSVERPSGGPTFPNRELAGVSGIAIRRYAQDFVARLARARAESGHYFEILGMGGVTDPQSFEDLYALGASAVQTASGAFANPFLAAECVEALGDSLPVTPDIVDPKLREALSALVDDIRNAHPAITDAGLAAVLPLRADQAMRFLSMGAKEASRPARPKRRLRAV